jgi:hypothetical protein
MASHVGRPVSEGVRRYLSYIDAIPGWLAREDALLLAGLSAWQSDQGIIGDLIEIGTFQGKTAIALGYLVESGEELIVCDLFEDPAPSPSNRREQQVYYGGLQRRKFEEHFRQFHDQLPRVLQCPSGELRNRVRGSTCRLAHIDGSHIYDVVREDVLTAQELLVEGGIVAFDDYGCIKGLGVALAVWEQVLNHDLIPFCATDSKLYATWTPSLRPEERQVRSWLRFSGSFDVDTVDLSSHSVIRVIHSPSAVDVASQYLGVNQLLARFRYALRARLVQRKGC